METGIRVLLLTLALALLPGCSTVRGWFHHGHKSPSPASDTADTSGGADTGGADQSPPRVIEPQVERRQIKVPKIRSSNVELGLFYGALSIEDFGTSPE